MKKTIQKPIEICICDYCEKEFNEQEKGDFSVTITENYKTKAEYGNFVLMGDMCKSCAEKFTYIIEKAISDIGIRERYQLNDNSIKHHKELLEKYFIGCL